MVCSCFDHEYRAFSTINERLQFINQSIAVLLMNLFLRKAISDNKGWYKKEWAIYVDKCSCFAPEITCKYTILDNKYKPFISQPSLLNTALALSKGIC
jgi:hypothetical protein